MLEIAIVKMFHKLRPSPKFASQKLFSYKPHEDDARVVEGSSFQVRASQTRKLFYVVNVCPVFLQHKISQEAYKMPDFSKIGHGG